MKSLNVLLVVVSAFCGCNSYRFAGTVDDSTANRNTRTERKFRIANLQIDVRRGLNEEMRKQNERNPFVAPDPWSIPQIASISSEGKLINMIYRRFPGVFSSDATAKALDVKVSCLNENKDYAWSILCPYVITLGIAPAFMETQCECAVEVVGVDGEKFGSQMVVDFNSTFRMTCFSPFGLIGYERMPDATSQALGGGVFAAPHMDADVAEEAQKVFSETIANAVVSTLMQGSAIK